MVRAFAHKWSCPIVGDHIFIWVVFHDDKCEIKALVQINTLCVHCTIRKFIFVLSNKHELRELCTDFETQWRRVYVHMDYCVLPLFLSVPSFYLTSEGFLQLLSLHLIWHLSFIILNYFSLTQVKIWNFTSICFISRMRDRNNFLGFKGVCARSGNRAWWW